MGQCQRLLLPPAGAEGGPDVHHLQLYRPAAPELIDLQIKCRVHPVARMAPAALGHGGEEYAVELGAALAQPQLQMPVLAHVLGPQQRGAQQAEQRSGVAAAIGLQHGQGLQLLQRHRSGVGDGHVDLQCRLRLLSAAVAAGVFIHPVPEGRYVAAVDGKARRQLMSAEAQQQVLAVFQCGEQIKAAPAAAAAFAGAAVQMDHKAGPGVFFRQAAGHDAHHALVPPAALQHQRAALALWHPVDHLLRLGVDILLYVLALPVQSAQLLSHGLRRGGIGAQQQLRRLVRRAHASGSVDPRRQHKADLHRGDLLPAQTRLPQQGVQADKVRVLQRGQPAGDDGAVFAGHLHDVRYRADGRQRAVPGKERLLPVRPAQGQHQLQRHAAAGQMLEGVRAVRPVGVHHSHGPGQDLPALVVVGDDHVQPQ